MLDLKISYLWKASSAVGSFFEILFENSGIFRKDQNLQHGRRLDQSKKLKRKRERLLEAKLISTKKPFVNKIYDNKKDYSFS